MIEDQNWAKNKNQRIIGADEVGRGSLAGPIVGAAVKLEFQHLDLLKDVKDSKKLSPKKREEIYERVKDNKIEYSISECSNLHIDQNGISVSNKEVLFNSIKKLYQKSDKVYVDHFKIDKFKNYLIFKIFNFLQVALLFVKFLKSWGKILAQY